MFNQFRENMLYFISRDENKYPDDTINWDFIDADMYMKWSVMLDGETYTKWFDKVADEVEGVAA